MNVACIAKLVFCDLLTSEFMSSSHFFIFFLIFIFFSLEASKLGEKELALVKQERVNFLSKKYSSVGGSCALFLEMDKVIF